jgi:3-deoxy-D-manno-octulosonic-acid transferase
MRHLYFITIKLVEWLLPIFVLLINKPKLKLFSEGRKQTLKNPNLPTHEKRYWFHCASLGEFEQARPVIESLKHKDPTISIVITFFSPSGYELRKGYPLADAVFYLPLDTPANAIKIITKIKPTKVVFVKYEIWYFLLKALFTKGIPVYLISANFRSNQRIFGFFGNWLFQLLPQYKHIFLQNQVAYDLLKRKGLKNISISGDNRFDRVIDNAQQVKKNEIIEKFKAHQPLLILGSSWPKEEAILFEYLEAYPKPAFKIIIAPHDISESHIDEILKKIKTYQPQLYTNYDANKTENILILNTIGHLASAYYYANMAFIGGGFTGQLHNILEPLSFGVPVIAGPNHSKFPEADLATTKGVFFNVSNAREFEIAIQKIMSNDLKNKAIDFINSSSGATALVVNTII